MTYPFSPSNGQTKLINGVSYVYISANTSWIKGTGIFVPEDSDAVGSLYLTSSNGITFADGTVQTTAAATDTWLRNHANASFTKANSANVLAQAAYTQANTGTSLAQAAFNVANNVSGGTALDGVARNLANTAAANTIYTQGVDAAQNTRISIIESVNNTQNNILTIIQGVNTDQNTRISIAEGVDATQNTNINSASILAQSAFNKADAAATTGKAIAMAMVFGG